MYRGYRIKGGESVITTSAGSGCAVVDGPATGSAIELFRGWIPDPQGGGFGDQRTQLYPGRHLPFAVCRCHDSSSSFENQFDCLSKGREAVVG